MSKAKELIESLDALIPLSESQAPPEEHNELIKHKWVYHPQKKEYEHGNTERSIKYNPKKKNFTVFHKKSGFTQTHSTASAAHEAAHAQD